MTTNLEMKLELVPIPVSDVDRAKAFYVEKLGFHLDHDVQPAEGLRVVQITPPGSGCSILLSTGMGDITQMVPGSLKALHLVVKNVRELRDLFISRGIEMGDVIEYPGGIKYSGFADPDGNSWLLQEVPPKL